MVQEYRLEHLRWRDIFRDHVAVMCEVPYVIVNKNSNNIELAHLTNDEAASTLFSTEENRIYRLKNPFHRMFRLEEFL